MEFLDFLGMGANLLLLVGPLSEVYRAVINKEKLNHKGVFVFFVVTGILFNSLYLVMRTAPNLPLWNLIQNGITITLWIEIYNLSRNV